MFEQFKLMTITQKKIFVLASVLAISLTALTGMSQVQIFAEETDDKQYTTANDIAIHTVFFFP